jgi:hypothetical protein
VRYNAERWSLCILPVKLGKPLPVVIVTLKDRMLSPVVELFIEHAREATKTLRAPAGRGSGKAPR